MKNIIEFYSSFFEDDWVGKILGSIMILCTIFLLAIISYAIFYVVDSTFLPDHQSEGIVVNKNYYPSHYTTDYVKSGDLLIPIQTYHPEEFVLTIKIGPQSDNFNVNKELYNKISIGETFNCQYVIGRISSDIYISKIWR